MDGVSNSRADTANQRYVKMCKVNRSHSVPVTAQTAFSSERLCANQSARVSTDREAFLHYPVRIRFVHEGRRRIRVPSVQLLLVPSSGPGYIVQGEWMLSIF